MDKPKEILSTTALLDGGASLAGYQGEMQYHHALQLEFDRRNKAEADKKELRSLLVRLRDFLWSQGYADQTPIIAEVDRVLRKGL